MTPELEAQLAQLRDIRLPDPIGWWPLAMGWWLALATICAVILAGFAYLAWRKQTTRFRALRELERLPADNAQSFAAEVSTLLRRVARRQDAEAVALSGGKWAAYLTQRGLDPDLAAHLVEATYAADTGHAPKPATLREAAALWIKRQS